MSARLPLILASLLPPHPGCYCYPLVDVPVRLFPYSDVFSLSFFLGSVECFAPVDLQVDGGVNLYLDY